MYIRLSNQNSRQPSANNEHHQMWYDITDGNTLDWYAMVRRGLDRCRCDVCLFRQEEFGVHTTTVTENTRPPGPPTGANWALSDCPNAAPNGGPNGRLNGGSSAGGASNSEATDGMFQVPLLTEEEHRVAMEALNLSQGDKSGARTI